LNVLNPQSRENVRVPLAILNAPTTGIVETPISLTEVPALVRDIDENRDIEPADYTFDTAVFRVPNHSVAVRSEAEKLVCGERLWRYDLEADPCETSPVENPPLRDSTRLKTFIGHQMERESRSTALSDPDTNSEF
jgi:hypothetical protein